MALGSPATDVHHDRRGVGDGGRGSGHVHLVAVGVLLPRCRTAQRRRRGCRSRPRGSTPRWERWRMRRCRQMRWQSRPLQPYRRPMRPHNPQAPLPAPRTKPPLQRAPPAAATAASNEKIPKMLSCRRSFQTRGSASQNHHPQGPFNSRKRPTRERRFRAFMMAPLRKRTEQHP